MRAGAALQQLFGPMGQAVRQAVATGGALQSPEYTTFTSFCHIIAGCSALCSVASLGEEAAVQMSRTVPLLTDAGLAFLEGMSGPSGRRCLSAMCDQRV
jgi:hypothetical protein